MRTYVLTVTLAVISLACATETRSSVARSAAPNRNGWLTVAENDSMRISVDTTGAVSEAAERVVWIAINDISTPEKRSPTSPFLRFETQQEVNCVTHRARGLNSRIPDSSGVWRIYPVSDSSWQSFDNARLPGSILHAVCSRLLALHSQPSD